MTARGAHANLQKVMLVGGCGSDVISDGVCKRREWKLGRPRKSIPDAVDLQRDGVMIHASFA